MYNQFLVVPFVCWLSAQLIKFLIRALQGDIRFQLFYVSGGMPSAHSAVVVSMATVAAITQGLRSPIFGVTAILALIVMYDSLGVRRMAGEQAMALNKLVKALSQSRLGLPESPALHELKGHTPLEVLGGALLGSAMAALFNTSKLKGQFSWLSSAPTQIEVLVAAGIFLALVIGGFVFRIYIKAKYKKLAAAAKLGEAVLIKTQVIGWPGLLFTFAAYQKASYLAWRLWIVLLLIGLVIWDIALLKNYRGALPKELEATTEIERKQRWLKAQTKKKRL